MGMKPRVQPPTVLYTTILADPPWRFGDRGNKMAPSYSGQAREYSHYETMSTNEICGMGEWVQSLVTPSGFLFLWAPVAFVIDGSVAKVARAWGYEPKQEWVWVKTSSNGEPRLGGGHYARICTESLVLCTRGRAAPLVKVRNVPNVFFAPRGKHSAKPDVSYERIEAIAPGPYLELFARRRYSSSWGVWGDEV